MEWSAILLALSVLGVLGLLFGVLLSIAGKKFEVKQDERVVLIREQLGGANCGACGFAGCDAFAEAVAAGEARVDGCPPGGPDAAKAIGNIMGVDVDVTERNVARILCQGAYSVAQDRYNYEGFQNCRTVASMSGGNKLCPYSCVGLGDCVTACAFNAISLKNQLAHIDPVLCGGCGECVKECPRGVISLMRESASVRVLCRNKDTGKQARESCMKACIGCKRCVKECSEGAITVEDNLARIDVTKCNQCGECVKVCPIGCITNELVV